MDRIDLHAHTTWSDGTCDVGQLFERARRAGLDTLALTDHDTVEGWAELPRAVADSGVSALPGIEVSAEHGSSSVHVLALLVDPGDHTELSRQMAASRASRLERARTMVDLIAADHPVRWEDVTAQAAGDSTVIGRPHIADALVERGVIADRSEAFVDILAPSSPYYVPYRAPTPLEVVTAIRASGGVAVLAHPASGTRDSVLPDGLLEELAAAGLDGVEVDHREHDEAQRDRLRDLAAALDLLVTGGSDYHGDGKPNLLGENLTSPRVLAQILERATSPTTLLRP